MKAGAAGIFAAKGLDAFLSLLTVELNQVAPKRVEPSKSATLESAEGKMILDKTKVVVASVEPVDKNKSKTLSASGQQGRPATVALLENNEARPAQAVLLPPVSLPADASPREQTGNREIGSAVKASGDAATIPAATVAASERTPGAFSAPIAFALLLTKIPERPAENPLPPDTRAETPRPVELANAGTAIPGSHAIKEVEPVNSTLPEPERPAENPRPSGTRAETLRPVEPANARTAIPSSHAIEEVEPVNSTLPQPAPDAGLILNSGLVPIAIQGHEASPNAGRASNTTTGGGIAPFREPALTRVAAPTTAIPPIPGSMTAPSVPVPVFAPVARLSALVELPDPHSGEAETAPSPAEVAAPAPIAKSPAPLPLAADGSSPAPPPATDEPVVSEKATPLSQPGATRAPASPRGTEPKPPQNEPAPAKGDLAEKSQSPQSPAKPGNTSAARNSAPSPMSRQSAEPQAQPIEVDRASQPRTEEAPDDPARVEHIAREPEISAAPQPQPTRQISLRLDGANSGHVDVQLQERAGKVQIAVRTPDSGLAKSLQSDLSDLVNRLEVHGFKTESWVPAAAHQAAPPAPAASRAGANPGQEHSGSGTRDGERQQRDSNQRRPSHRAAFAETLTTEEVRTDNL